MNKGSNEYSYDITVWINENDKIVSFHEVPGYVELKVNRKDFFNGDFQDYIEKTFRFQ